MKMGLRILESNVRHSFTSVKRDMQLLKNKLDEQSKNIAQLNENQKFLLKRLVQVENLAVPLPPKQFVGSRTTLKFHGESCPFAKNINPENRVIFASVEEAVTSGYVPDTCL